MSSKPLISFVLIAYKQERYIREAVMGALAQTYSPLEIILSDDCSPDRTFQTMQKVAGEYSGCRFKHDPCERNAQGSPHKKPRKMREEGVSSFLLTFGAEEKVES